MMKRLAAALLATTCLTAPSAARAEPISTAIGLTALIAGTGLSTAIAGAVGGFLITTAISVGISMAASALLAKPSDQAGNGSAGGADLSVSYGAALPRSAIMGPGAVGGHHVYTNVYGPTNEAMDCVFVIGDGQHGRLTRLKYNGRDCTLPAGGLAHGVVYAVPEFVVAGTPCVGITYYSGRYDQVADPSLIAHANPAGRWTSDHRGRGVAYLYVHQIYAEGDVGLVGIPQVMMETEGLVLYDPRKDSTNGGSGSHRWGQIDTYEPSANPAVQEYNFRRGVWLYGGATPQRVLGMTMSPVNLILQMYFAAANINDEAIPLAEGGTEPRYRCSIAASDDRSASDVLSAMRAATAGWSFERGGQFGPVPGVPQIPIASLAFTDDDLIVGASARFTKYRSRSELVTATYGQFADPAQFWVSAAFPPRENAADDAAIGERIAKSLDLTQVYSSSQAQRIAESERRKTLQQGQGTATLPAKWIGVQPGDWLPFNSARHGTMTVLVTGTTLDTAKQQVTITYERTSNSVYSWTTAGELFPPDVGEIGDRGTLIMIASGMSAVGVVLSGDSGLKTPGIQFSWDPIFDPTVDQIDFEIRKLGDSQVLPFTAEFPEAGSAVCSGHGIQAATTYEYRHKLFTVPERDTPWSAWANVISGSDHVVPSALSSVPIDLVTLQMFEAGLRDYVGKQLKAGLDESNRIEQLIASVTAEQEAANRLDDRLLKQADVSIRGQVSALTGGKTWRGDYSADRVYLPNDMVRLPDGTLYSTQEKVKGVSPPAAPWQAEQTAAIIAEEWRTFAGPDGAAAQTSDLIEARFTGGPVNGTPNDLTKSVSTIIDEWTAFAGPTGAGATTVNNIEARFGADTPISLATLTDQWEAFAGPDRAVAQSETTTLAQIADNSASISTNATAIATVDGKVAGTWQITVDVNHYISGIKAYNDGTTSLFKIIADTFIVAQPGVGGGAEKSVFQIANVNGSPELTFRGQMFADGTITATKIAAGEIRAVHVGANQIITDKANIANLVVDNIHIRGAAITVPGYQAGSLSPVPPTIAVTLATVALTFTGVSGSIVTIQAQAQVVASPGGGTCSISLRADGSQIAGIDASGSSTNYLPLTAATTVTATGASQTVTLTVVGTTLAGNPTGNAYANLFGVAYLR